MASDPEPSDLVVLQKPDGTVGDGHPHGVDGFSVVDPLELEAAVLRVLPKEAVGLLRGVANLRKAARGTPPRSAASRATSQLLGIEGCSAAGGVVGAGFGRECAQGVL
jgi:hypothetical protein